MTGCSSVPQPAKSCWCLNRITSRLPRCLLVVEAGRHDQAAGGGLRSRAVAALTQGSRAAGPRAGLAGAS